MTAGIGLISVTALIAGLWLWWHREAPKTTTGLFLVAGLAVGGVLGNFIGRGVTAVFSHGSQAAVTQGTGTGTGVGTGVVSVFIAGVAIAATAELVIKGLWRRRATPRRWHPWLALALPTIAIAAGAPLVGPLMTGLSGGVANVGNAMITTASTSHTDPQPPAGVHPAGADSTPHGRR